MRYLAVLNCVLCVALILFLRRPGNEERSREVRESASIARDRAVPRSPRARSALTAKARVLVEAAEAPDAARLRELEALALQADGLDDATCRLLVGWLQTVEPPSRRVLVGRVLRAARNRTAADELRRILPEVVGDSVTLCAVATALAGAGAGDALLAAFDSADRAGRMAILRSLAAGREDATLLVLARRPLAPAECEVLENAWRARPDAAAFARIGEALPRAATRPCVSLLGVLTRFHASECTEAVVDLLHRRSERSVASAAIAALGSFGTVESAEALAEAAGGRGTLADEAARSLSKLNSERALVRLAEGSQRDVRVRRAVLAAISRVPRMSDSLHSVALDARGDEDPAVRRFAELAAARPTR